MASSKYAAEEAAQMILTLKDIDGEEDRSEKDDSGEESIDSYEKSSQSLVNSDNDEDYPRTHYMGCQHLQGPAKKQLTKKISLIKNVYENIAP